MTGRRNQNTVLYCSPGRWEKIARKAAQEARMDPVAFLAGKRDNRHAALRWELWRALVGSGFSYASIGRASGFDHTSVRYACLRIGNPCTGANVKGERGRARRLMRQSPRQKPVATIEAAE